MEKPIIPIISKTPRTCGDCTRCCEGWLEGTVWGQKMFPGQPCFYLEKACTIYKDRPADPCRNFTCEWLKDPSFPAWLKPNLSNVIITKKHYPNSTCYVFTEAGARLDVNVLNWIIQWAISNQHNIIYGIDGKNNCLGNDVFQREVNTLPGSAQIG